MARRPERGVGRGTSGGRVAHRGNRGDGSKPRNNPGEAVTWHADNINDGSSPRYKTGDGTLPRPKLGAAMAHSDDSTPRTKREAISFHSDLGSRKGESNTTDADRGGNGRKPAITSEVLASSRENRRVTVPPGDPITAPRKKMSDAEHALVARGSRLRHEASASRHKVSEAESIRERFSKPTRTLALTGDVGEESRATKRGIERNTRRLKVADASDAVVIGESRSIGVCSCVDASENPHLPSDATSFFPLPTLGPDDAFEPPSWFLEAVRGIAQTKTRTPLKPPIRFESSDQAATHNARLIQEHGFSLASLIREHRSTTLGFGSEFRTVEELRPLLGGHTHFEKLADLLNNGMEYIFDRELNEAEREGEVKAMLARGNHKSAKSEPEQVQRLIAKDVLHGFTIPIPTETVLRIPGAMVQPLGLVKQWTVGPEGERTIKYRLTQDLSYSTDRMKAPTSINSRVDMDSYPEMIYGWCLPRILHYIVALRIHQPKLLIFISKYDYSDAYRRIAHSAKAATQTVSVNGDKAFVSLRLTFGGSPNPPTWCMFSEIVTDLANEIAQCENWDHEGLRSPAQMETPKPFRLPAHIPIARGREMAVMVPLPIRGGKVDGFIDDLINVFWDTPENCARQPHVVPLAMHVTNRPHAGEDEEPVPRRPILSLPKLMAEGRPEEVQTVLGWNLDTRRLEISLPEDKYKAWTKDIQDVLNVGHCSHAALETLVGRLNHTAYVLPNARHFLSRIREGLGHSAGGKTNRRSLKVSSEAMCDLKLWGDFLTDAHSGVSMNLLVTRTPDKVCWSDACPYGIGGYSLSGRAWRIRIPQSSHIAGHKGINNLLEFLGMAVNIWLSCLEEGPSESCILAIGDNTSALGWLHNTSHLNPTWEAHTAHLTVARKIATLLMEFKCCLASQHIKGELNLVTDLLSFSGSAGRGKKHPLASDDPANDELTARFLSAIPSQVPENFAISQLPDDVLSWVTQVLQVAESSLTADRKGVTRSTTGLGDDGKGTVDTSATTMTSASLCYPSTSKRSSSELFSTSTELQPGTPMADLPALVRSQWSRVLCAKPQATWLRRFGGISGKAPFTSRALPTCDLLCECG